MSSPTERDERGNVNNIIIIGDVASVRPSVRKHQKVSSFSYFYDCIFYFAEDLRIQYILGFQLPRHVSSFSVSSELVNFFFFLTS